MRVVVQVRLYVVHEEARLQVELAPRLADALLPELDVEHVLVLAHPNWRQRGRQPLAEHLRQEGESPMRPRRMSMVPAHGPAAGVLREPVLVVRISRVPVSRHPMHWHDGVGVLLVAFTPRGREDRVHPGEDDLVEVHFDACARPDSDHGPDLVEVERQRLSGRARPHPVNDEVGKLHPGSRRFEVLVEVHHDNRPAREEVHGPDQVRRHPLEARVPLPGHVGDVGLVEPAGLVHPLREAIQEPGVQVHIHQTRRGSVITQRLRGKCQQVLRRRARTGRLGRCRRRVGAARPQQGPLNCRRASDTPLRTICGRPLALAHLRSPRGWVAPECQAIAIEHVGEGVVDPAGVRAKAGNPVALASPALPVAVFPLVSLRSPGAALAHLGGAGAGILREDRVGAREPPRGVQVDPLRTEAEARDATGAIALPVLLGAMGPVLGVNQPVKRAVNGSIVVGVILEPISEPGHEVQLLKARPVARPARQSLNGFREGLDPMSLRQCPLFVVDGRAHPQRRVSHQGRPHEQGVRRPT
mmetsp:Transcript_104642/g.326373  ORF Transcript_104642/g.326373 Transcript_104642/m.326373 type:complete len:528 (-) Transcript_104642:134-1717(-)